MDNPFQKEKILNHDSQSRLAGLLKKQRVPRGLSTEKEQDLASQQRLLAQLSSIDLEQLQSIFAIQAEVMPQKVENHKRGDEVKRNAHKKSAQWKQILDEQFPAHSKSLVKKHNARKRVLACLSLSYTGKWSRLESAGKLVIPYKLNVQEQAFEPPTEKTTSRYINLSPNLRIRTFSVRQLRPCTINIKSDHHAERKRMRVCF